MNISTFQANILSLFDLTSNKKGIRWCEYPSLFQLPDLLLLKRIDRIDREIGEHQRSADSCTVQ
jgi:hypothetical protein